MKNLPSFIYLPPIQFFKAVFNFCLYPCCFCECSYFYLKYPFPFFMLSIVSLMYFQLLGVLKSSIRGLEETGGKKWHISKGSHMILPNYTSISLFNFSQFSYQGSFVRLYWNKKFLTLKKKLYQEVPWQLLDLIADYLGWPTCRIKNQDTYIFLEIFKFTYW